jgi:hypothetical protein
MNYLTCVQAPGVEVWTILRSFDDVKKLLIVSAKMATKVDKMEWEQMSFYDKVEYVKMFLKMVKVQKIGYDDEISFVEGRG